MPTTYNVSTPAVMMQGLSAAEAMTEVSVLERAGIVPTIVDVDGNAVTIHSLRTIAKLTAFD